MRSSILFLAAASSMAFSSAVAAQDQRPFGPVRGGFGMSLVAASPQGEFANQIDAGYGVGLNAGYNVTPGGALRLRLESGFIQYGSETTEVCFSSTVGCRVRLDLVTSNQIAYANLGPELVLPLGWVQPHVSGGFGFSYFQTGSHVTDRNGSESVGSTTNLDDFVFALTGGAGLYVPIKLSRKVPLALDLSARYHRNGVASYLREGDIKEAPDGEISFTPRTSEANLLTWQIGVSMGIRDNRQR